MRILFVADIHGSLYFTNKALEAFYRENANYIVLLGDVLYHGARNPLPKDYNPAQVANLLNKHRDRIIAVRGNCDSEVDQMVLSFPIMSDYSTILCNERRIFLTHGHIYNKDNLPKLSSGDILFYGHTHINEVIKTDNIYVINLASITLPKENNPHSYGILDNNIFTIKNVEGNIFREIDLT
ncbi:MAG: phosphodiesterase [Clostridiales bacterium]|nr:phosphodiesterase [Clostridiales bacterium]